MKKILIVAAFLVQLIGVAAQAAWVPVDFSTVSMTTDITTPNNLNVSAVNLSYDNFGSTSDFAAVDPHGIFGTTFGTLVFAFSGPTAGLKFDFALFDTTSSPQLADALIAVFSNGESVSVPATFDGSLQEEKGSLSYQGAAFNQAFMFFSVEDPFFSVENVSYLPVPEPTVVLLLAVGLFGLAGSRRLVGRGD
jgi:hypothetical protein